MLVVQALASTDQYDLQVLVSLEPDLRALSVGCGLDLLGDACVGRQKSVSPG